jgi:hypothetical protein
MNLTEDWDAKFDRRLRFVKKSYVNSLMIATLRPQVIGLIFCPIMEERLRNIPQMQKDYKKFREFLVGGGQFIPFIKKLVAIMPDSMDGNMVDEVRSLIHFFMCLMPCPHTNMSLVEADFAAKRQSLFENSLWEHVGRKEPENKYSRAQKII